MRRRLARIAALLALWRCCGAEVAASEVTGEHRAPAAELGDGRGAGEDARTDRIVSDAYDEGDRTLRKLEIVSDSYDEGDEGEFDLSYRTRMAKIAALQEEEDQHWAYATLGVLVFGFFWTLLFGQGPGFAERVGFLAAMLHAPMQWMPLWFIKASVASNLLPVNAPSGQLEEHTCTCGLKWKVHFCYALTLVLACPVLSMAVKGSMKNGKAPFIGIVCPSLARGLYPLWLYAITIAGAADQYLDATVVAAALSCEWRLAWLMFLTYCFSIAVQAFSACLGAGDMSGAAYALMAVSPEGLVCADENMHQTITERLAYQASIGLARLFTENVPQSLLQGLFVKEVVGNKWLAYASMSMSLCLGLKYFLVGLQYWCCRKHLLRRHYSSVSPHG